MSSLESLLLDCPIQLESATVICGRWTVGAIREYKGSRRNVLTVNSFLTVNDLGGFCERPCEGFYLLFAKLVPFLPKARFPMKCFFDLIMNVDGGAFNIKGVMSCELTQTLE